MEVMHNIMRLFVWSVTHIRRVLLVFLHLEMDSVALRAVVSAECAVDYLPTEFLSLVLTLIIARSAQIAESSITIFCHFENSNSKIKLI